MWSKTGAALLGGCLISISIMLNLNYLLNIEVDEKLLIGLLVSFPIWAGAMTLCYASETALQAWKRCAISLVLSAALNAYFFSG